MSVVLLVASDDRTAGWARAAQIAQHFLAEVVEETTEVLSVKEPA